MEKSIHLWEVIDYVMWDEEVRRRIKRMKIGNKIDSDHHSMEVWIGGKTKAGPDVKRKKEDWYRKRIWNEEEYEMFSKKLDMKELGKKV